jgi:signal transduction histidine kinase
VGGRPQDAMPLYEAAIRAARAQGLVQNEALAYETAARFYAGAGYGAFAALYRREARACYARWGAEGKVRQMDGADPQEAAPRLATLSAHPESFDLLSVVKASQSVSRAVDLEEVLRTLVRVVLEQSGAERGMLVAFPAQGDPSVEAAAVLERDGTRVETWPEGAAVPLSLLQYVRRTRESLVLPDAAGDDRFADDPYVRARRPRSVLAAPVIRQSEVSAVLYLENNALVGAFTRDRLAVVEVLAAQAAISVGNAQLFRQAQDAIRLREEFVSVASHELNTPVTGLLLALGELSRSSGGHGPGDAEGMVSLAQVAERQGQRLARLVAELLDVTRLDRGELALKRERVELGALAREVAGRLALDLKRARCELTWLVDGPVVGLWDPSRIDQVLTNLLSNALKFGAGQPVEVRIEGGASSARIAITDHGIGIDVGRKPQLFHRFERAVSARNYGGLGLGLYISRRIVEAHGGQINVSSRPGEGATFTVELPREPG